MKIVQTEFHAYRETCFQLVRTNIKQGLHTAPLYRYQTGDRKTNCFVDEIVYWHNDRDFVDV